MPKLTIELTAKEQKDLLRRAGLLSVPGQVMSVEQFARARLGLLEGVCQVCGCTDESGCPGGCEWANRGHTLCSACADLILVDRDQLARLG